MLISEELRRAIRESGKSGNAIAKEAGVSQSTVARFMQGNDIKLSVAEVLAEHFGMELRVVDATAPKKSPRKKA